MVVRVSRHCSVLAVLLMVAALLAPVAAWARSGATGLRLGAHPDGITRLVIDLSEAIDFSTALYADPYRVVVNTPPMGWSPEAAVRRPLGAVQGLRFDEDSLGGRIMIDLREPATVKSAFVIPPRDGQGWRFVMDLQAVSRAAFLNAAMPAHAGLAKAEPKPAAVTKAEAKAAPVPVVKAEPKPLPAPRAEVARAPEPPPPALPPAAVADPVPVQLAQPIVEAPRSIVITSPEARPAAKPLKTSSPVMSAPVPPPLERPAVVQAAPQPQPQPQPTPALAAPLPEPAPVVTKVSAPVPAPLPEPMEPKGLPADGKPVVVIDPGHGAAPEETQGT